MTLELVLLWAVYAMVIIGLFLGDHGVGQTFKNNLPYLSARIERNLVTGNGFIDSDLNWHWQEPTQ